MIAQLESIGGQSKRTISHRARPTRTTHEKTRTDKTNLQTYLPPIHTELIGPIDVSDDVAAIRTTPKALCTSSVPEPVLLVLSQGTRSGFSVARNDEWSRP
jgi:hypothetical protein